MLEVSGLSVSYGGVQVIDDLKFEVRPGEVVTIIGANGAGKTTTLKTVTNVSELGKSVQGSIKFEGQQIEKMPAHKIARLGIAHVPEGRKVFPNQTVEDNLILGAFQHRKTKVDKDLDEQYERFPRLGERKDQKAGLLSGGEQQMLAIGRALMSRPSYILFDEPSMGLAPIIVGQVFNIIRTLKQEGKTILLVEQMAFQALGVADRAYVIETGRIVKEGSGAELLNDPAVKEAYLGA
ncbi:MAG: ABC transporter ATP-binding protein [Actinomycetota bacterium]